MTGPIQRLLILQHSITSMINHHESDYRSDHRLDRRKTLHPLAGQGKRIDEHFGWLTVAYELDIILEFQIDYSGILTLFHFNLFAWYVVGAFFCLENGERRK